LPGCDGSTVGYNLGVERYANELVIFDKATKRGVEVHKIEFSSNGQVVSRYEVTGLDDHGEVLVVFAYDRREGKQVSLFLTGSGSIIGTTLPSSQPLGTLKRSIRR
jgi:hypothetical protein